MVFMGGRLLRAIVTTLLAATLCLLLGQSQITVGEGSPTSAILGLFLQAFARGNFSTSVALPPASKVRRLGSGYVQDFNDVNPAQAFSFALAKPDSLDMAFQMCCQILTVHNAIGSFTGKIGFPVSDPISGPQWPPDGTLSLQQNFEGGHVILLHQGGAFHGQAFFIRDPYVSKWRVTPALSIPISQERDTASRFSTTATQQDFLGGVIVLITSGARKDKIFTVSGPIYARYFELGGIGSFLGYPIGDETTISGRQRQDFEGGLIEFVPGSGLPAEARAPVASVVIDATPLNLQAGNVVQRTVEVFDSLGRAITDRPVTWTTSNSSVVQVQGSGLTATLRAVGPGFANVVALVDGVASAALRVNVTSVCCQVGEGAPNAVVRQAMQDALSRNSITPRLPTDNPVRRLGAGFVQEFIAQSPPGLGRLLVVKADASGQAYVVSGERLARYLELGGVVGALGFATSDANAAGRQMFENQFALAGSPPVLVRSPITGKWRSLGFEGGAAGAARSEAVPAGPTAWGSVGLSQTFAGGAICGFTGGARAGQAYLVSGPILARYLRLNGPAGILGLPISDAFSSGGRTQQNFEGGSVDFAPGDSEAQERPAARVPSVTVIPNPVSIGGRVRISISGFAPGRRLTVSVTSQPDFEVTPAAGAYGWDQQIRAGVAPGVYQVVARDAAGNESAAGSYRVRLPEEARLQLTKVSGDNQSALPGSEAPFPLVVRLTDEAGNPIAGWRVLFAAIAGAAASPAQTSTDGDGFARTKLRLPPSSGLTLVNAEAGGRIVTFAARAEDGRLTTFPTFRQAIDDINVGNGQTSIHKKGSLLTALAALFRYYQDRGELPAPAGLADPASLNQFLLAGGYLPFTLNGRAELVADLPRALSFVSDAADFEPLPAELNAIRDSVNLRSPVLLGLMLRSADQDRGAHYVVATGVAPDGSILIYDPSPDWNRASLAEYLNGFTSLGRNWTGRLLHALRLRLEPRSRRAFLVHGPGGAAVALSAPSPSRGYVLRIPALAAFDEFVTDNGETAQLLYSDGTAAQYQLNVSEGAVTVRGAAVVEGLRAGVYRISPDPASFSVVPQTLAVVGEGLRNAASFGTRLSPGSLASLFGAGLGEGLGVTVGGRPAELLFLSPFQANLQLPFGLAPGTHAVEITSRHGADRFNLFLDEAAPGIFLVGPSAPAVLNQDGTLNAALNPARRGAVLQVFATGLGEVAPSVATGARAPASPLSRAIAIVTATLEGRPAEVLFAGLAPGFIGLYQINILIPPALAPNAAAQLVIRAAGLDSNLVAVAV